MTLEYALNKNGIKSNETNIDTSIDFAATTGAFISGTGDFVTAFEPTATKLEKEGNGYIVASVGKLINAVPYTTYNAKKSYIENNKDVIKGFKNAIQKGLDYVKNNSSKEIAQTIKDYFPDNKVEDLTEMIQNYKDIDSWYDTTYISEEDFNNIQEIVKNAGKLDKKAPYSKLVYTKYSKK